MFCYFFRNHNGYKHFTVNHSIEFKNEETGAHTNTIEGLWRLAKLAVPPFNRKKQNFLGYLATFMLKRKWKNEDDSFATFMKAAAILYTQEDFILDPKDFELDDYSSAETSTDSESVENEVCEPTTKKRAIRKQEKPKIKKVEVISSPKSKHPMSLRY